ncbi:MAG: ubiquitin-like protein Pup [Acidimicrobiia bacterium]|nr:ubiquitin-like protein Pup [Acidimicrobiia bacterium]MDH5422847.1 ubiquitin-like protein Pup [Acidimicrobiia bacterium]MDH5503993.1 ubiquitin-like protein Pup [Acidimicrobiia bacterium]
MSEQEQQRARRSSEEAAVEADAVEVDAAARESVEITDELLDEIDSVLEENAEEMVKNYVQKGGE